MRPVLLAETHPPWPAVSPVLPPWPAMSPVLSQLGAVTYACRIPERWFPGKFDIAGHSHQLWHTAVVLGAWVHYLAMMILLQWRDAAGEYELA